MSDLTSIAQLTSDANTLRDARKLAASSRWQGTGRAEAVVWGLCQGSARESYRTCLDTGEPGYKCTCPSRKQPCKHVAALALLVTEQPDLFALAAPPEWVATWQTNRARRRAPETDAPPDPAAQAARAEARELKVRAGLDELRLWLQDLVRHGLTDDRVRTYAFWDRMAARMVDAQAPGVARRLRGLAGIPMQGKPDWAERLLDELAALYLLAEAYPRLETLPEETQADLRTGVGWPVKQEELQARRGLTDTWHVLGQLLEVDDRLHSRRVWLHGERCGRKALLLDFAHGKPEFEHSFSTGTAFTGTLVYYPGALPLRAAVRQRQATRFDADLLTGFDCDAIAVMLDRYANALARNPWVGRLPFGLRAVTPYTVQERTFLRDATGAVLPVSARVHPWLFAAVSGDQPIPVFGEWDGSDFTPRTIISDGQMWAL
jgi:hypothetical protein